VLAFLVTLLAQAGAPVGAGAAYDMVGGYGPLLWALVLLSVLASVSVLRVGRSSVELVGDHADLAGYS
jgi:hypothetical protein